MNNIIFIHGPDNYSSLETLRAIKNRYLSTNQGDFSLLEYSGDKLELDSLVRQTQALPLFSPKRLIIIRELLKLAKKDLIDQIPSLLPKIPSSTLLVIYESFKPDSRTKTFNYLNKNTLVKSFPEFSPDQVKKWIRQKSIGLNLTIDPEAVDLIIDWFGADLNRISNELEKLANYSPQISVEKLRLLTNGNDNFIIYQLTDKILSGSSQKALQIADYLLRSGQSPTPLIALIGSSYRNLILVNLAISHSQTSSSQIAKRTGINPYILTKLLPIAQKTSLPALALAHRLILFIDSAIKRGIIEDKPALDLLITKLAQAQLVKEELSQRLLLESTLDTWSFGLSSV